MCRCRRFLVRLPTLRYRRYLAALLLAAVVAAGHLAAPSGPVAAQGDPTYTYPTLYVTPSCLSGGEPSVHGEGRNFDRNRSVEVWDLYQYSDFLYGNRETVTATNFGTFEVDLPINLHDAPFHGITAIYSDDSSMYQQTMVLLAPCDARLTLNPRCADSPGSIDVAGSGFVIDSTAPIEIEVYSADDSQNRLAYRAIDAVSTSFDVSVQLNTDAYPNGLPAGQYRVQATQNGDSAYKYAYTFFAVPCPTITVSPLCGAPGTPPDELTLVVTASGFLTSQAYYINYLEIVFDSGGKPQEFVTDASNGSFAITPYRRGNGNYTIVAKQGYFAGMTIAGSDYGYFSPAWTDRQYSRATTVLSVPCAQATPSPTPSATPFVTPTTLTVEPACGAPQLDNDNPLTLLITVTGSGFQPGALTLTYDPNGSAQTFGATALSDRTFSRSIPVRAGPEGIYRVVAHQEAVGAFVPDAEATFNVPCTPPDAVLAADVPCGPSAAGVPAAYPINLTGSGFLPGRVEITFDAGGALPEPMPPVVADATGAFVASVTPSGRGPGAYSILAHQQVTGSGTVVEKSITFLVACGGPVFQLMPDSGPRGLVITVEGHNFPPNVDILLRWSLGIDAGRPTVAHSDANGDFSRQVLIFNSDFIGPRELSVELAGNPPALAAVLPVEYRVTAGTVSPPFSLRDNPFAAPGATIVIRH
jgi:hypothetical protein